MEWFLPGFLLGLVGFIIFINKECNNGVTNSQPGTELRSKILRVWPIDGQWVKNRLDKYIVAGMQQHGRARKNAPGCRDGLLRL